MGSSPSVCFAEIFVCHLETELVTIFPKLNFIADVDDIIVLILADYLTDFLQLLNSFHTSVNFTVETEKGGQFSFLDVTISRLVSNSFDDSIITSVFRKQTFTGLFTNWNSWCPKKYKVSVVKALHKGARRLCASDNHLFSVEVDLVD